MTTPCPQPSPVPGRLYDGRSARARTIRAWFLPGPELVLQGQGFEQRHPAADIRLEPAVDNAPRLLRLPGGQGCEFADTAALDTALAAWPGKLARRRHAPGWRQVVCCLLALALISWVAIAHLLPFAARRIAFMLPASTMETISRDSLRQMDEHYFRPSRLPAERRDALLRRSREFLLAAGESGQRRIEFRHAPAIGANAMALPSGVIVFTDDLVRLATHDEQLLAVLAHECGHVQHRHSLRGILQKSAVVMALTLVAGKQRATDTLQAALTASLLDSRYSREFEFEADAYAAHLLKRAAIPPSRLAEILDLLERQHPGTDAGALDPYLRSHPATSERIRRLDTP